MAFFEKNSCGGFSILIAMALLSVTVSESESEVLDDDGVYVKVARAFRLTMVMMIIMCSYLTPSLPRLTKLALRWFLDGWFSSPRSMFA